MLGILGGDVEYADGQLTVTLGRGHDDAPGAKPDPAAFASAIRTATQEELDARCGELLDAIEAGLFKFGRQEEQRRVLLARAVDVRYDEYTQVHGQ